MKDREAEQLKVAYILSCFCGKNISALIQLIKGKSENRKRT